MARDQARPAARSYRDAATEYHWGVFLHGYYLNETEAKQEFAKSAGLNRKQRRRLETKTRRLRNRQANDG